MKQNQTAPPATGLHRVHVRSLAVGILALCAAHVATGTLRGQRSMTQSSTPLNASLHGATDAAHDTRPIIACFGDSLTAGYGVDADSSYPADLQRDLDGQGYSYRVVNLGISGETTKDGLARIDRVLALKPAIVVVEFGGNDGLRGVPIASSRANLEAMLQRLTHSGTHTVIAGITLPPQYSSPYIREFNQTYVLLARQYKLPLLPFVLQDVYGVPGSIQPDGIHPTAQGCVQVAKNVLSLIKPLLKKQGA